MKDLYLKEEDAQKFMPTIAYEIEIAELLLGLGKYFPDTVQWTFLNYDPKLGRKRGKVDQLTKKELIALKEELVFLKKKGYTFYYQKDL